MTAMMRYIVPLNVTKCINMLCPIYTGNMSIFSRSNNFQIAKKRNIHYFFLCFRSVYFVFDSDQGDSIIIQNIGLS